MQKHISGNIDGQRRGRRGKQERDLLIGLGVALCLGLILVVGLVYFGGSDGPSQRSDATLPAVASETGSFPPPVRVPPRVEEDQRITATRRAPIDEVQAASDSESVSGPSDDRAAAENRSGPTSGEPSSEAKESADDENNPRKLLRRTRRQVKAGEGKAALETTRRIASLVEDVGEREKLEGKIAEAEGAARRGQNVDFDSLIELIESTIAPNSWASVGGAGPVEEITQIVAEARHDRSPTIHRLRRRTIRT